MELNRAEQVITDHDEATVAYLTAVRNYRAAEEEGVAPDKLESLYQRMCAAQSNLADADARGEELDS